MDLADQAAQHRARAHLNIRCDALRRKAAHDGFPPHRRRHLRDQRFDRGRRVALRLGVDVGHDRHARVARLRARADPAPGVLRRLHQRAVERRAHRQRDDAPGAQRLARARPRVRRRRVAPAITTWPPPFRFAGLTTSPRPPPARLRDDVARRADDRRHRAGADRHRLLHVTPAAPHDAQRVGKAERARRHVRGVLAKAVPRDEAPA